MRVEKALTQLIVRETKLHLKVENMKRSFEGAYDSNVQIAFRAIDDWNYNYIDEKNLRRFLRNMGHLASKPELVAIIRRFDTDGDAKVNIEEFKEGIKSHLTLIKKSGHLSKTT
jgi:Ca2+-binding EF-hand superfamily protein